MTLIKSDILAKKDAAEFRRAQGLSAAESVNLESLLLQLNVLTVFLPLQGVSGMALRMINKDKVNRFILVNSNHSIGRQNFTICHELYHLFIQKNFIAQVCQTAMFNKKDENEYRADLFASHFLMPEDGIERLLKEDELTHKEEISLASLLKLEQYFGSSRSAIMTRLSSLGYEGFRKTEKLSKTHGKDIQKKATEYGYDISLYKTGNQQKVIGDYGVLSRQLFERELISESRYAELMQDIFVNIYTPHVDETENA
jgi:Zn-dependent peptidase ImmA (M78 family)